MNNNNHKMNKFPEALRPKYRHLFDEMAFTRQLENWRKQVFAYIINHETRGLTLTNDNNHQKIDSKILMIIVDELKQLGWKTGQKLKAEIRDKKLVLEKE